MCSDHNMREESAMTNFTALFWQLPRMSKTTQHSVRTFGSWLLTVNCFVHSARYWNTLYIYLKLYKYMYDILQISVWF